MQQIQNTVQIAISLYHCGTHASLGSIALSSRVCVNVCHASYHVCVCVCVRVCVCVCIHVCADGTLSDVTSEVLSTEAKSQVEQRNPEEEAQVASGVCVCVPRACVGVPCYPERTLAIE